MGEMLKFGFVTQASPDEVRELEALGADSLWVGGHIASRNPTPEAMVQLARLAGFAKRARIGTSILLLPLYPPAIVAKQIADIDRACEGRVTLGIGVGGEYPQEFRACGIPVQERGRRTDEMIPLLRRLWTAEEFSHPGPFYPMEQVRIHPAPAQGVALPIVVAGRQEPAMRRAARLGDGWMPYLFSPRRYAESVARVRQLAAEAGRDLSRFEWMEFLFTNVGDDAGRAREEAAAFLGGTYAQDFRPMVDRVAAAGTPEGVAARVQEFVDAGTRHIIFAKCSPA
jgi:probable F420-dependent oxidoreductase